MNDSGVMPIAVDKVQHKTRQHKLDLLAVEEPLEIRLKFSTQLGFSEKSIAVTMRTPGHDFELVTGFLLTEGIITTHDAINKIYHCQQVKSSEALGNVIIVVLKEEIEVDLDRLKRHFYMSSSCGVCGKASIQAISTCINYKSIKHDFQVEEELIKKLPIILKENQLIFGHTGSLHAAGLFDEMGNILLVREDVGRHNALDKLIGAQLYRQQVPLSDKLVIVSGRLSFELVQKALIAGVPIVVAIGAPSSLAVKLADKYGITLIGFVKNDRFTIYTGAHRINM